MARRNEHVTGMPLSLIIRLYAAHRCAGNYKITSSTLVPYYTRWLGGCYVFAHDMEDAGAKENMPRQRAVTNRKNHRKINTMCTTFRSLLERNSANFQYLHGKRNIVV